MADEKKTAVPGVSDSKGTENERPFRKGKGNRARRGSGRAYGNKLPSRGGNDFEFWNEYPELMGVATRFPWMHISGTPLTGQQIAVDLANVAVQHYVSVPGISKSATDPINLSFRQLFLDMHRKYRGIGAYEASDIAIAMICIESMFQLIVEAERIYGILNGYPIKSRVEPEGLLKAMGYTTAFIDSVKSNMADYRYGINRIIELAKRLPLPNGMNFMRSHVALNGFVYRDSKDVRSGLLVFVFDNYFSWQGAGAPNQINSASTAYSVRFVRSSFTTYQSLLTVIEGVVSALLADSDILRITSDFIACYGENNMQVLTPLPEDYSVVATYSESILHKWHNSERTKTNQMSYVSVKKKDGTMSTYLSGLDNFAVYQADDVVISRPTIHTATGTPTWGATAGGAEAIIGGAGTPIGGGFEVLGHIADSWMEEPTQEAICEACLWRVQLRTLKQLNANIYCEEFLDACTEILGLTEIVHVSNSMLAGMSLFYETNYNPLNTDTIDVGLCQFDWHPLMLTVLNYTTPSISTIANICGDVDNVTTITQDIIHKIVDAALLSAFKVRLSGKAGD